MLSSSLSSSVYLSSSSHHLLLLLICYVLLTPLSVPSRSHVFILHVSYQVSLIYHLSVSLFFMILCFRGDQPQAGFNLGDAVLGLTRRPILSTKSSGNITAVTSSPLQLQFGGLVHAGMASLDMAAEVDMGKFSFPRGQIENWGDSGVVVTSPRSTDVSTDADTDDRNQAIGAGQQGAIVSLDSSSASKGKAGDQKALRRLAQNREAARKSRLRKKVGLVSSSLFDDVLF